MKYLVNNSGYLHFCVYLNNRDKHQLDKFHISKYAAQYTRPTYTYNWISYAIMKN